MLLYQNISTWWDNRYFRLCMWLCRLKTPCVDRWESSSGSSSITLLHHKLQMAGSDAEQFSLRWNNFHSNLVTGFHALLQEVELVDVTLAAEGQFVQAHKIVLSVCSPYFKQLFQVNPCKHPIVILKDVGHKELIAILQFMYQGEVNVRQEELADFLKTAELLQIKGLTGSENSREPDRTPSCTTPQPSSHRQPGSQIHVSDVRSEAHLSEVSQGYPSGNDGSLDLPSPVSEETTPTARPAKRLHSDASVSSSTLSHRKEQKEEHFVQKIPKVEPIDLDMDSELTSDHLSPEGLQQFLTNSGKSTQPRQNISAGGNVNSTPAVPQSHSIHPPSILRHGQVSETSVGSVPSASQAMPRKYQRKTQRQSWSLESMTAAIEEVLTHRMGYKKAAKTFGVPQSTLEDRVKKARLQRLSPEEAAAKSRGRYPSLRGKFTR